MIRAEGRDQRLTAFRAWLLILSRVEPSDRTWIGVRMPGDVQNLRCIVCRTCPSSLVMTPTALIAHLREDRPDAPAVHDVDVDEAAFDQQFAAVTR